MKSLLLTLAFGFALTLTTANAQVSFSQDSTELFTKNENLYVKGQLDADRNYHKYKGAGTGTLIASLVSPLIGLVSAIICSANSPKTENLGYPNDNLLRQQDYYLGYTQKAKKIKQRKVWTNWGIGFGANLIVVLIIAAGN